MKQMISMLLLCLFFTQAKAQNFGGHPSNIDWKHIDTENTRIIFPKGDEEKAFRIANMIDHIHDNNTASVGDKSKKLRIVLHNNQVISNGFVGLSPYRSEFFGTAPQDFNFLGSMEWLDALTIHEYRHSLQFANGNRGLTKLGRILFGQNGWNALLNLSVPNWYFEGDAVVSETLLSEAGRGRTPAFFAPQRANLLNGVDYTYMKSRNGSFKDIVPNHYPLGYTMCNYTRNHYGTEVWSDILRNAGAYRYPWLYPFSFSLKKNTGFHVNKIYQQSYDSLQGQWLEELKTLPLTPTTAITEKNEKMVTSYKFVQVLDDGNLVAIKKQYNETPIIVKINKDGEERKITDIGLSTEDYLSENNNQLAWTEYSVDIRRENVNYSNVVTYDITKGEKRYITTKTKYFSPHFNSQGDKIIVVEANQKYENSLIILNNNGEVIQKIENPNNWSFSYPKWTTDDKSIVYLAKANSEIAFFKYDLTEATTTQLTDWTHHTITVPNLDDKHLYFSASYSGIDNIYAVNLNGNKEIIQLSSVKIGAYQPAILNETLYMSELTERGYMLSQMTLQPSNKFIFKYVEPAQMQRYNVTTTETEKNILDIDFNETYEVKNYNTLLKDLQLHSWGFATSLSTVQANLQFGNVVDDLRANLIVDLNTNEGGIGVNGDITVAKWFTELSLKANNVSRASYYYPTTDPDSLTLFIFQDRSFGVGANVPLSWIKGNYTTNLSLRSDILLHNTSDYSRTDAPTIANIFPTWENYITFSRLHRKAVQHILPRYGQEATLSYKIGLINQNITTINLTGTAYFPGLSPNHGIAVNAGFTHELQTNPYQFRDEFEYTRGYYFSQNDNAVRLSANYHFPIVYPDWGFWNLVYFKRVRGNVFADFSTLTLENQRFNQNSVGLEIIFDNTYLNLLPLSFGVRGSYLFNPEQSLSNKVFNFETFAAMEF